MKDILKTIPNRYLVNDTARVDMIDRGLLLLQRRQPRDLQPQQLPRLDLGFRFRV